MKIGLAGLFAISAMILFQTEIAHAQCTIKDMQRNDAGTGTKSPPVSFDVSIGNVSLGSVSMDRLELKLALQFIASRGARVRRITFSNLRLNDVPIYAAPITEPNRIPDGKWVVLPHPLSLTVYYRDLESLRPLEILLSENRVRLEGTLYADLDLNLLQEAILFSRVTRVPIGFVHDSAFEAPGGPAMRALALRMVRSAEQGMNRIGSGAESVAARLSRWRQDLWHVYAPSLLLGYARLRLIGPQGEIQQVECSSVGFRTSSDQFILQKSLVEPWRSDPEIAAAVKLEHFRIDKGSYDLWVWPANAKLRTSDRQLDSGSAFSLNGKQIRVVHEPREQTESLLMLKHKGLPRKIQVLKRDAPANVVLLEFTDPSGRMPKFNAKLPTDIAAGTWDKLAMFRFADGINADQAQAQLILMPARLEGSRIRLDGQVDWGVWGSPLISQEGVVGIVQHEKTGVTLGAAFEALYH